jgi:hypothetical protein
MWKIVVACELVPEVVPGFDAVRADVHAACSGLEIGPHVVEIIPFRRYIPYDNGGINAFAQEIEYTKERVSYAKVADPTGDVYIAIGGYVHGAGSWDFRSIVACETSDGRVAISFAHYQGCRTGLVVKDALSKVLLEQSVSNKVENKARTTKEIKRARSVDLFTILERQQDIAGHLAERGLIRRVVDQIPIVRSVAKVVDRVHIRRKQ